MKTKSMFRIKVNCETGTHVLKGDAWENERHTITWADYDTMREAVIEANALRAGLVKSSKVWVEDVNS